MEQDFKWWSNHVLIPLTGDVSSWSWSWKFSLSVIASTFPIKEHQIIAESCQTPHRIHHWKVDDILDQDKYKRLKKPITCYISEKQGVQGSNMKLTVTTRIISITRIARFTRMARFTKFTRINRFIRITRITRFAIINRFTKTTRFTKFWTAKKGRVYYRFTQKKVGPGRPLEGTWSNISPKVQVSLQEKRPNSLNTESVLKQEKQHNPLDTVFGPKF